MSVFGRLGVALVLLTLAHNVFAAPIKQQPPVIPPYPTVEAWRIRLDNSEDGAISISLDAGNSWQTIGRVTSPATRTLMGYLAAGYAPIGTVAATAVHGIRIRVGDLEEINPELINILPKEFAQTPDQFGGHIAGDSGIYTNIPAGVGLFREFAPYVGSRVYLQDASGTLAPLRSAYAPALGDVLVIVILRPTNPIRTLTIENVSHGGVVATFADGSTQTLTTVAQPVSGVGRFDGCSYTGVGAINTNHTCVITVSTSPVSDSTQLEGFGPERRGGFQIEPAFHNGQTEEAGAPQILILGDEHLKSPQLEGTPPLFSGYFSLAWAPDDPAHSWTCDIRTADKPDQWQPMPELIGNLPDAFTKLRVTAFRLQRPMGDDDKAWLASRLKIGVRRYSALRGERVLSGKETAVRGVYTVYAPTSPANAAMAQLFVDGKLTLITNDAPFYIDWDTKTVADGEHMVEERILDANGGVAADVKQDVWVDNAGAFLKSGS